MGRALTQLGETRRWVRKNREWLTDDHAPMVQALISLAKTMDTELSENGMIKPSTASAYRSCYITLMDLRPNSQKAADALAREDDSLMKPMNWTVTP